VDALADKYQDLLAKHGIVPLVRTEALAAERLTDRFPYKSFDISYAENSLDHSYDPGRAIEEMFAITKKGGVVILSHPPSEGADCGYQGLHQWNFKNCNGEFVISSPACRTVNISRRYSQLASIVLSARHNGHLVVEILKNVTSEKRSD
jgi:SAM-dependent methyltransferase